MRTRSPSLPAVILCAVLCAGLLPAFQAKADPAEVALQAAFKAETVDGDLKGAIALYRKLAAGGNRAVAAKALVRMGQCYEKLGDAEARAAYDRVVREFADQKEPVAAAQARLAALDSPASVPALVARRVWTGPGVNTEGAPSWDGRVLSFTDRNTSNIALRDLSTGTTRVLTKNSDEHQYPAYRSIISPDGKTVAYAWITGDVDHDIRLIGSDGSRQRVLFHGEALSGIELGAWSPDGSRIVATLTAKDKATGAEVNRIALIAVGDGSARDLKTLGPRRPRAQVFSRDGHFIACDYPPRDEESGRDIFLLAADGSEEVPLVQHPADDRLLGWAPDGKGVLFVSDRANQWGAWFIQVADGKPKGSPELIIPDLGDAEPLGVTRSGSYFYGIESGGMDAYVAELDPAASRLMTAPARIDDGPAGDSQYPLFSPDGRSLAYFSNKPGNRWYLCLRSLGTGEERKFMVAPDIERLRTPRWAPNGQAVLVTGVDRQLQHLGFYLFDARTGIAEAIMSSNPQAVTLGGQSTPDGKSLLLARAGLTFTDKASRVLQHDPATGSEREIYRAPTGADVTNLALSPDGLELAFSLRSLTGAGPGDGLWIMPVQGGNARELLRLNGHESIRRDGLVWTPDGRRLLFAKSVETDRYASRLELWRISPRDGEPYQIAILAPDTAFGDASAGLSIHPDGKNIAFHAGRRKPEVWVLDPAQPAPKAPSFLNILQELTVEAWINTSGIGPSIQTILAKGTHNYEGAAYALTLTSQGKLGWGVRHGHTYYGEAGDWSIDAIVTDTTLQPNTWYHAACTLYSSKSASIYLNGSLSKTGAITQSILSRPTEPLNLGFSSFYGIPSSPFHGLIDEMVIYDRVLSANEILQHYQAGLERHKSPDVPPVPGPIR